MVWAARPDYTKSVSQSRKTPEKDTRWPTRGTASISDIRESTAAGGRVGHEIAHTLTTGNQQGTLHFVDISPPPLVTDVARCLNTRQDSSIHNHRGESSGVLVEEPPRAVLTPAREKVRQNGRRMKEPEEPMFTITATDRHGVIYHGRIRRLTPRECLRLQGYRDGQISKMEKETSDNQLYKQAGNGVTVNVIEAIGRNLKAVDEEIQSGSPVPEAKGG